MWSTILPFLCLVELRWNRTKKINGSIKYLINFLKLCSWCQNILTNITTQYWEIQVLSTGYKTLHSLWLEFYQHPDEWMNALNDLPTNRESFTILFGFQPQVEPRPLNTMTFHQNLTVLAAIVFQVCSDKIECIQSILP